MGSAMPCTHPSRVWRTKWAASLAGRPSSPLWASGWTPQPVACQRLSSSQPPTRATGSSSAAAHSSPCWVCPILPSKPFANSSLPPRRASSSSAGLLKIWLECSTRCWFSSRLARRSRTWHQLPFRSPSASSCGGSRDATSSWQL
uniref:Alternative protein TTC28 n=1 Tax=Homo sapiens TaxID=9606 RepID=L8E8S5_HUMAN|nr:alternative protein TTC28 [Homo sapiens]